MDATMEARYRFEWLNGDHAKYDTNQLRDPTPLGPTKEAVYDKPANGIAVVDLDANNFGTPCAGVSPENLQGMSKYL